MGPTITYISHEPRGPESDHKEPGGSMSDCIKLILNKIFPKYNCQYPGGSTSDRIKLAPNNIRHIRTKNKITAQFTNKTNEIDTTKKFNDLHQKYVDITKNT